MTQSKNFTLLVLLLILLPQGVSAQPVNDECDGALTILEGVTAFDNLTATDSGLPTDPSQCMGSFLGTATRDLWFSYTATENGFLDVTTCPAGFDTDLIIYGGDCGNLSQLSCNGDACFGFASTIVGQPVDPGVTYLIRVGGFNGTTGSANLELTLTPANDPEDCSSQGDEDFDGLADCADPDCQGTPDCLGDECDSAFPLEEGFTPFDNTLASTGGPTSLLGNCDASGAFNDLWYSFSVPENGFVELTTCPGSSAGLDTDLFLYAGDCTSPNQLACDGDACGPNAGFGSKISRTAVVGGVDYLVRLGGFNGARGSGTLRFEYSIPGDDCFAALNASLGPTAFDTSDMTSSTIPIPVPDSSVCPGSGLGLANQDIWFEFVAPSTGPLNISLCENTLFDTDLIVYEGDCDNLQQISCNGDGLDCSSVQSEILNLPVDAGTRYLIRIGSYNLGEGAGQLFIYYSGQAPEDCTQPGDEDADGLADCYDSDCLGTPACTESGNCGDGIDNDLDGLVDCADWECDTSADCSDCPSILTQNNDPNDASQIVQICAWTPEHTENELLRSFDTGQFACNDGVRVIGINIGIGQVDYLVGNGLTTALRLYIDENGGAPDADMHLIDEKLFTVTESMSGTIQGIALDQPALIPYGAQVVVGFWVADSGGPGTGNIFRPGGNTAGESGDTWLWAPECGIYYRTLADIGLLEQPLLSVVIDDQGPGPSGDECESAIPAARGANPFETTGMSDSPNPFDGSTDPACAGLTLHTDRWYRYVPPSDGFLSFSTCNLTGFEGHFEIYRGSCDSLEAISASCDGTPCTGGSAMTPEVPVTGGEIYRFRLGASQPGVSGSGEFLLEWKPLLPYINEIRAQQFGSDPEEFIELAGLPQDLDGLSLLTIGSDPVGGSGVIRSVIDLAGSSITPLNYHITAEDGFMTAPADLVLDQGELGLEDNTNLTVLLVQSLTVPQGTDLDTDDDGTIDLMGWGQIVDSVSLLREPLASQGGQPISGPRIYGMTTVGPMGSTMPFLVERCPDQRNAPFAIGPADSASGGDSPRSANVCLGPPPNDTCQAAIALTEGIHILDTASATSGSEPWNPGCGEGAAGDMQDDVWFTYTAQSYGKLTLSTCDLDGWDTDLAIYSGDCQSPIQLACNGDAPGSANGLGGVCQQYFSRISDFPVHAGDQYLIRVGGWESGEQGVSTLTLSQEISGDLPCDPIAIGPGNTFLDLTDYSLAPGISSNPTCAANGPLLGDAWLTLHPVADCTLEISTCSANGEDPLLEIYTGSCDSIETTPPIACAEDGAIGCSTGDAQVSVAVSGGTLVHVRVGKRTNDSATTNLNIECVPTSTIIPPTASMEQISNGQVQVEFAEVTLIDDSDPGNDPFATLQIDWGDGSIQTGLIPGQAYMHRYEIGVSPNSPGPWTPTLTIENSSGSNTLSGEPIQLVPIGDANMDGSLNVADVITILGYLFSGNSTLNCPRAADLNADTNIDIADAIYGLSFIFVGGEAPAPVVNSACDLP
ncbi:MAG: hypothetical protein ACPHQT_06565 [Planctomycetota bacterium]